LHKEPATGFRRRIECQPGAEYVHFAVIGDGGVARLAARNELEAARDCGAAREAAGGNNLYRAAGDSGGEDHPGKTNDLRAAAADRRVAVDGGAQQGADHRLHAAVADRGRDACPAGVNGLRAAAGYPGDRGKTAAENVDDAPVGGGGDLAAGEHVERAAGIHDQPVLVCPELTLRVPPLETVGIAKAPGQQSSREQLRRGAAPADAFLQRRRPYYRSDARATK
jgi:hypothetical protein